MWDDAQVGGPHLYGVGPVCVQTPERQSLGPQHVPAAPPATAAQA